MGTPSEVLYTDVEADAGASLTLNKNHAGGFIRCTSASGQTVTVPPDSDVDFEVGTSIKVEQAGAGVVDIVAGAGVTIESLGGNLDISGQGGVVELVKVAADTWVVHGDLMA